MRTDMREPAALELTPAAPTPRARDVAHGAARGVVAAMAMTGIRAVTGGLGMVLETPPQAIIRRRAARLIERVQPQRRDAAIELAHWAYGAAGGATYALLPPAYRRRSWGGVGYGLVVWTSFELVIAPALGIGRTRARPTLERLALGADHFLYGLVVAEIRPSHKAQR